MIKELQRVEQTGIIEPVEFSEWAAPIVPVLKRDESHPVVVRMKAIARNTMWWSGVDKDLEEKVRTCQQYQVDQKLPSLVPMHPWEWPKHPWAHIHIDHLGQFQGKIILVVVDAYSKWIESVIVCHQHLLKQPSKH